MDQVNSKLCFRDFEVIKELGTGSYGRVQLVKRRADNKKYALKSMFLANAKQKEKQAALNQIRLLASIEMPYVISYKTSFYVQDLQSLCIVMEYADGGDLEGMINRRMDSFGYSGFDEDFIWNSAFQILKGLKGLHQSNIIHRDMKCANIFYVDGIAKIGDLNISKITDNGFASTQTGTPYYTSPQIWKGEKYDSKCDIWALGCIIYEMCTLLPPFRAQDFPGLFKAISNGTYAEIPAKYSNKLRQFLSLCFKVDPLMRSSAGSLLQKPYFAKFDVSVANLSRQLQDKKQINLIDPIECPKMLQFINSKLPKSKFQQSGKQKTVGFTEFQNSTSSSFKIKTKKIRSEKTIQFSTDDTKEEKVERVRRPVPHFVKSKSSKQLPPIERQTLKSSKSIRSIASRDGAKSAKLIGTEKEIKRVVIR